MTIPTSTYRLQFRNGMTFRRAVSLVPYLKRLGISHLYASPVFAAASGSTHGYDVADANRFDPEIGTEEEFEALSDALQAAEMGLIVDIVPNHMAASLDNVWWRSVIEYGQASRHAHVFDIDWNRRLTLPWLPDTFEAMAETGDIALCFDENAGCLAFSLPGMAVPLDPSSYRDSLEGDDGAGGKLLELAGHATAHAEDAFHEKMRALLSDEALRKGIEKRLAALSNAKHLGAVHHRQNFELIHWREAPKRLSYRRFFEVTDLVGVNVEDRRVFDDTHRLILDLVRAGRVQGLRVDHIDGLSDPAGYLRQLRDEAGEDTYLIVEKILEDKEDLPADWPISGTTGYEFIDRMTHLLVEKKGAERLRRQYAALGGETDAVGGLDKAKQLLIGRNFEGEVATLKRLAVQLALSEDKHLDIEEEAIDAALKALLAGFPVYRTYGTSAGLSDGDAELLTAIAAKVQPSLKSANEKKALDFLVTLLTGGCSPRQTTRASLFRRRFQQLTGPLMAKSLEDTLFYRQMPVLGLNEVGGDAARDDFLPRHFHAAMAERAEKWPLALSSTSTHDTKRGEDARARLYALTSEPQPWIDGVTRWRAANSRHVTRLGKGPAPEPELEWALFQGLLGAFPPSLQPDDDEGMEAFIERLHPYVEKSLREAKLRSDWVDGDEEYETAVKDYVSALLSPDNRIFLRDFHRTIQPYLRAGAWNGIAQAMLKMTAPGIPDIYQGSEQLDLSLVDPDNRREPNYELLQSSLDAANGWPMDDAALLDGRLKQCLIARTLPIRSARRDLFEKGDYRPLGLRGAMKEHVVAFMRRHEDEVAVVIVPRLPQGLMGDGDAMISGDRWLDTAVDLPDGTPPGLIDAYTGRTVEPQTHLRVGSVAIDLPVALLVSA